MRTHVALAAVTATLVALALPALAGACNTPEVGLSKTSAGRGDTISFTIVNLEPGGTYEVTAEGHALGSGTSTSADGFSGTTAPLPDLGATRQVEIRFHLVHHGPLGPRHETGPWTREPSIRFVAPASTVSTADAPTQGASEQPAPAQQEAAAAITPAATGQPARPASRGRTGARSTAQARTTRHPATRGARRSPARPRRVAPPLTAAPEVAPARAAAAPRATRTSNTRHSGRPTTAAPAHAQPSQRAWAPRAAARSSLASGDGDGHGIARDAVLALALLLLAHAGAALARMRRRVRAAALPDTEEFEALGIEHELQEMIAAERAAARERTIA